MHWRDGDRFSEFLPSRIPLCRPAEVVAPDLVGCKLVKRQPDDSLLWGVVVETELFPDDPACHGYSRRYAKRNPVR